MNNSNVEHSLSKVPEATAVFWIVKILATTLGEVGGNLLSMNMGLGYLQATLILATVFVLLAVAQIRARAFHPWLYWTTIVASTTAGTTLADYVTRSIGIGYAGGSVLLFSMVLASLAAWRITLGAISADTIGDRRTESFYWLTITFSQTLGTALGDWFADTAGFGYLGSTLIFGAALLVILYLHWRRLVDGKLLFWAAFILTRPLGAVVGNFFDKANLGGLGLDRTWIVACLFILMAIALVVLPQRAGPNQERNT